VNVIDHEDIIKTLEDKVEFYLAEKSEILRQKEKFESEAISLRQENEKVKKTNIDIEQR
jgi:hypothetical protein